MKFHFEPNLDYQHDAIEAVCDLFRGQEICSTEFTVVRDPGDLQHRMAFAENDLGIAGWRKELDPAGETTVVFRESAFPDDVAKTNLTAILEQNGLGTVRSL